MDKIEFFTVSELAGKLRFHDSTIYRMIERGQIKASKIGGSIRISALEYERIERSIRNGFDL